MQTLSSSSVFTTVRILGVFFDAISSLKMLMSMVVWILS